MIWNETNNDENKNFNSFNELEKYIKSCYLQGVKNLPKGGYDKFKIELRLKNDDGISIPLYIGGLSRLDIGLSAGDYNPFNINLKDYIIGIYRDRTGLTYSEEEIFEINLGDAS